MKIKLTQEELLDQYVKSIKGIRNMGGKIVAQYGEPQGINFYRVGLIIKRSSKTHTQANKRLSK